MIDEDQIGVIFIFFEFISKIVILIFTNKTLFSINHSLLDSLGVSHKSLNDICFTLQKHYNLNTKLTGAGGGGCAITLIPKKIVEVGLLPNIIKTLEDLPNYNFECFKTTIGAEGLICHSFTAI